MPGSLADGFPEFADAAAGLMVPPSLQTGVDRHRAHLVQLAASLRASGMPDAQIVASINMIVASYRTELVRALNHQ